MYGGPDNDSGRSDYDLSERERESKSNNFMKLKSNIRIRSSSLKKVGLSLLGFGTVLTMLGVALFFEKNLIRMGNFCVVCGTPMVVGTGRTASYFLQPKKARATLCLSLGVFLVFVGRPMLGMGLELFGILNLFGNFFPIIGIMIKRLPTILGTNSSSGGGGGGGGYDNSQSNEEDLNYYNDHARGDNGNGNGNGNGGAWEGDWVDDGRY